MRYRRSLRIPLVVLLLALALAQATVRLPTARAACAYDPDALTIHQMIKRGTTGSAHFDVLFLGRVRRLRDLGGDRGGPTLAKFSVRADPVGAVRDRARVRFWKPPPGEGVSENFEFHRGSLYAVVAHRRPGGIYRFDGACGQTTQLSRERMRDLIHLFRQG